MTNFEHAAKFKEKKKQEEKKKHKKEKDRQRYIARQKKRIWRKLRKEKPNAKRKVERTL